MPGPHCLTFGQPIKLSEISTTAEGHHDDRDDAEKEFRKLRDEFIKLQACLYAEGQRKLLIVLQALINMGVNVGLAPAKGMTLPFISAGGSSMIAIAITCGMLIAVTRRRPGAMRPILSQFEPDAARDHAAAPVPNEAARSAYPLQSRS